MEAIHLRIFCAVKSTKNTTKQRKYTYSEITRMNKTSL